MNDVEVASVAAGPGPGCAQEASGLDVVLVHGLGVSNRYLVPAVRELARHHRVLAPDLPGVGRSSRPDHELSMIELADGLARWMEVVGVGPALVVGHSLGCQVVAQLAARHPDRVAAVVLASPAPDPSRGRVPRQAWRLFLDGFRESPAMVLIAATDYPRVGVGGMLHGLRASARRKNQPHLRAVDRPTLIVRGERDPLVSAGWADALAQSFPDATVVTLPGAPHGIPCSTTGPFVDAVRAFAARLPVER